MDNDSIEVNCTFCGKVFNLSKSLIEKYDGAALACTYNKVNCPHCKKARGRFLDIKRKQEFDERKNNPQPHQPKPVCCPKCNSTQFHSSDKGFSAGKALGGALVTGGIGLLAGFHGSKKVVLTCLSCGHKWNV